MFPCEPSSTFAGAAAFLAALGLAPCLGGSYGSPAFIGQHKFARRESGGSRQNRERMVQTGEEVWGKMGSD
eukprot:3411017-Rhodomonas_salina.1